MKHLLPIVDQSTQEYLDLVQPLSFEQFNWKPAPNKWSIAQCVDHIIVSNKIYWPVLEGLANKTYKNENWIAKIPFWPRLAGKLIKTFTEPSRAKKTKTVPVFEPSQSNIELSILDEFVQQQKEMKVLMEQIVSRPDIGNELITSPATKMIVFSVADLMEVLVLHEQRHLLQAKEVLQLMAINR